MDWIFYLCKFIYIDEVKTHFFIKAIMNGR